MMAFVSSICFPTLKCMLVIALHASSLNFAFGVLKQRKTK